ncbi:ATP-binding cassette domain-containing protein [Pleurocapsales cyanobacterium LEGE 06147]|nr:ATP-binding cassette domain-containing protein [Pleurocapsales cyanobacterium LEGE 06147]
MLKYLSKVWYILKGSRKSLPLLLLVFIFSSVLEAIGIGLIGPFLNLASNPDSLHQIPLLQWTYLQLNLQSSNQFIPILGLGIGIVFCIKSFLYFFAQKFIFSFSFNQRGKLESRLLKAYLTVPYTFYLRKNTASIINNIIVETQWFTLGCLLPLLNSIANLTVVFVLVLLLAQTDLLLLVIILAVLLPTFLLFYKLRNQFKKWGREASQANQETIRIINHGLGGLKETRVIGCEPYFQQQMEQQVQIMANAATSANSFQKLPRIVIETCLILFLVIFVSVSQLFFEQNIQELTSILAVFAVASMRLIPAASQLVQAMGEMQNKSYCVDRLYLDLKEIEKQKASQSLESVLGLTGDNLSSSEYGENQTMSFAEKVELNEVTYRYPDTSEPAIDKVSLSFKKGQSIALIGKSGAGKTTLVDVILGLLQPESGNIYVDGISVYSNIRSWQNLIGYIPQSIFLIDDTIERNIAFGVSDRLIDRARIDLAIKAAQLEELIEQLPDGIKTVVGERGVRLSGGQRQRIGIARALYHEREILVLDEATSALDNETEKLVSEAIRSLAGTKTLIIIAHRLSTVEHCDRVYLLEKGHVIKSGSYREVVLETC